MTISFGWPDAVIRLLVTVVAGLVLGYNRSEHGKVAGMRTILLVCLAASIAMIQVNLLLPMQGRPSTSFITNDLMRLPLGILTGVGFIGGGAILHRDNLVQGVTTAATLWLATVIGLCIGGGQILLGLVGTMLGLVGLWGLRPIEARMHLETRGRLLIETQANGLSEAALRGRIAGSGLSIVRTQVSSDRQADRHTYIFEVRAFRRQSNAVPPPVLQDLEREAKILRLSWREPL